jgi:hypothetical protein
MVLYGCSEQCGSVTCSYVPDRSYATLDYDHLCCSSSSSSQIAICTRARIQCEFENWPLGQIELGHSPRRSPRVQAAWLREV